MNLNGQGLSEYQDVGSIGTPKGGRAMGAEESVDMGTVPDSASSSQSGDNRGRNGPYPHLSPVVDR